MAEATVLNFEKCVSRAEYGQQLADGFQPTCSREC